MSDSPFLRPNAVRSRPPLPRIAQEAAAIASVIAGFSLLLALRGSVVLAAFALIPLFAGIGIRRRHYWSAYGFAIVEFAQLLLIPLILLRSGNVNGVLILTTAIITVLVIWLFVSAGKSLAAAGAKPGLAWPWILVAAVCTVPFVFLQPFSMPSGSMENTLLIGDHILVQTFPKPTLRRGDLVVFHMPFDRKQLSTKRVIGAGGDRIRIARTIVYRNGSRLREPYVIHKFPGLTQYADNFPSDPGSTTVMPSAREMLKEHVVDGSVVVPEGKYFVLGDNRDNSLDSRYWGFLPNGDVIGKPVLIYDSIEQPAGISEASPDTGHHVRWNRLFTPL